MAQFSICGLNLTSVFEHTWILELAGSFSSATHTISDRPVSSVQGSWGAIDIKKIDVHKAQVERHCKQPVAAEETSPWCMWAITVQVTVRAGKKKYCSHISSLRQKVLPQFYVWICVTITHKNSFKPNILNLQSQTSGRIQAIMSKPIYRLPGGQYIKRHPVWAKDYGWVNHSAWEWVIQRFLRPEGHATIRSRCNQLSSGKFGSLATLPMTFLLHKFYA